MESSPNQNLQPIRRLKSAIERIDKTLAEVPTTQQNLDHLAAIEDEAKAELDIDVRVGWITVVEEEAALLALHKRIHQ